MNVPPGTYAILDMTRAAAFPRADCGSADAPVRAVPRNAGKSSVRQKSEMAAFVKNSFPFYDAASHNVGRS